MIVHRDSKPGNIMVTDEGRGPGRKFELMIGANVTFDDGTRARSYGHDPEVDVGMGAN